jgi:hypothetical protein
VGREEGGDRFNCTVTSTLDDGKEGTLRACITQTNQLSGHLCAAKNVSTYLAVSGACSTSVNGAYVSEATTHDGRNYYKNGAGTYLYYDTDCDGGSGTFGKPFWIFDSNKPSTTKANDLDGDGDCNFRGYIASTSSTVPTGANTWNMYCDGASKTPKVTIDMIPCDADAALAKPTITFDVPQPSDGSRPTILLTAPLPFVTAPVVINGERLITETDSEDDDAGDDVSAPSAAAAAVAVGIVLDGRNLKGKQDFFFKQDVGLLLQGDDIEVRGLAIVGCPFSAVYIEGARTLVQGEFKDTRFATSYGIFLRDTAVSATVGGAIYPTVITGNGGDGIQCNSPSLSIAGNTFIGVLPDGTPAPNGR